MKMGKMLAHDHAIIRMLSAILTSALLVTSFGVQAQDLMPDWAPITPEFLDNKREKLAICASAEQAAVYGSLLQRLSGRKIVTQHS